MRCEWRKRIARGQRKEAKREWATRVGEASERAWIEIKHFRRACLCVSPIVKGEGRSASGQEPYDLPPKSIFVRSFPSFTLISIVLWDAMACRFAPFKPAGQCEAAAAKHDPVRPPV